MSILSGFKKYKDYILTSSGYQLSSRWTKSDAVVMGDGTDDTNTLEKNLGSIKGITDSLTATSSNIALSAKGANDMYNELNSNLTTVENDVATSYEKINSGTFKKGNIQYINCSVQIPIDVNSEGTYFTIAYAPENLFKQHTFCGVISYANRIIPALFRITFEKNIQLFLSTEIINLGSVIVTAYINTDYMIQ